jgi:hypothetical protein
VSQLKDFPQKKLGHGTKTMPVVQVKPEVDQAHRAGQVIWPVIPGTQEMEVGESRSKSALAKA